MSETVLDHDLYAEELKLERDSVDRGVARYRRLAQQAVERGDGAALKPAERLLVFWFRALSGVITAEKGAVTAGRPGVGRRVYGPCLRYLRSDKMAVIAMHEAVGLCLAEPTGCKVSELTLAIGRAVNAEVNFAWIRRTKGDAEGAWDELVHTDRRRVRPKAINRVANRHEPGSRWPLSVQVHLGACLLNLLLRVATTDDYDKAMDPAFEKFTRRRGVKTVSHIRLSRNALRIIEDGHAIRQYLRPRYQPMVVPPLRWTESERGGYLELPLGLVKKSERLTVDQSTKTVREAINCLNCTAWRINGRILEVMETLWDSGGGVAGLPRRSDLPNPPIPDDFETDREVKKAWKAEAVRIRRLNLQTQAERIVFAFKLDVAQRFADYDRFWFPHQLDFRGRVYPAPLFLHHQGDDICRGLLEFADGKALGDRGRFWLKVHLANCCGVDKVSFGQRVGWIDAQREVFSGWVDDPLTNTGWMEADKPFQALAAAMALIEGAELAHLPVQVDASNNALQHYGAMLRCEETGKLVNLLPGDQPADVYADVAERVSALVGRDAGKGDETAKALEGWTDRKIVKQTVMTGPYGVTKVGARRQVYAHLKDAGFGDENLWPVSKYLSRICMEASEQVCQATHRAMQWLIRCGKLITAEGLPIRWTTPLGMEVEQPYRNATRHQVTTILQRIHINKQSENSPVSARRQVNGFAPNFVHSLDASHLMCTAIACHDEGITFAGVHDSFWAHAADADRLNEILREQFILLHETPALQLLYDQLRDRYSKIDFPEPPKCGSLDLEAVRRSDYFFS